MPVYIFVFQLVVGVILLNLISSKDSYILFFIIGTGFLNVIYTIVWAADKITERLGHETGRFKAR